MRLWQEEDVVTTALNKNMVNGEKTEVRVPCEVYSRVVGYLRPVQNWHEGKKQEFKERKTFKVPGTEDQS